MNITNLNVLIVEDDNFQRNILISMLSSLGITSILSAGNGKEALDIIHAADSKPIDVALCDLKMPEMDGMEFLRHLGNRHRDIDVILTSGMDGKLLTSVGKMTQMYGIRLLGAIEKPVLLANLKEHLLKHGSSTQEAPQIAAKSFTLKEILLAVDADQFEPFFQPKVDMKTGRLVGAEALARWVSPDHGVISPYAFIPQLEQSGNIDALTFRILRKSAAVVRSLHDKGYLLTVSVNLSLVSLDDTALADKITQAVREAGVEPQYIVLEITESAAMTNVAPALENLARLCMSGFALSIDDYGTGSSSLQQLTRIAFSELKIDQSFVKDFADNKTLRIVVESSIDMAHKLLVKSVAEGVETQQDWDALKVVGCDTAQGYFIAQPMNEKAFSDFVVNYKREFANLMPPSVPEAIQKTNELKILVVEDDQFTRKIILRVLRDFGYANIVDVNNAEFAINLLVTNTFDLIITDVNMPGMNGLKFTQLIRAGKTHAKPETRIVVLTSFSQAEIIASALALDINGFLVKPIIPAVVEEKLALALSEHLHLHSPIAYEAVRTELKSLPSLDDMQPKTPRDSGISLGNHNTHNNPGSMNGHHLAIRRLCPGMILKKSVHLKDGTLILSSGYTLSELSINRLKDIEALLPSGGIAVQEVF
ncbi:MAG: EAL domain-containing protein [Gallionella sp.]|nr:EAL domain-containing protein [Gallionella sp.]